MACKGSSYSGSASRSTVKAFKLGPSIANSLHVTLKPQLRPLPFKRTEVSFKLNGQEPDHHGGKCQEAFTAAARTYLNAFLFRDEHGLNPKLCWMGP